MVSKEDQKQIENHGLTEEQINKQLKMFENGIPHLQIITAATIDNGIIQLSKNEQLALAKYFDEHKKNKDIIKFVPASGAATRMFRFLHQFLDNYNAKEDQLTAYIRINKLDDLKTFVTNLKYFPFIREARKLLRSRYPDYKKSDKGTRITQFVKMLLDEEGLNFSNKPKGLIPFHKYLKYTRTAFEEQILEATYYAAVDEEVHLHFTFSPAHLQMFKKEFKAVESRVTKKTKVAVKISYSFQDDATDTVAVTLDNKLYRDKNNKLLFRPSGHGALLHNLNQVNADVIFVKNIDNVAAEEYVQEHARYKKMLGGKLLKVQAKIFEFLDDIIAKQVSDDRLAEMKTFLWKELNVREIPETCAGIAEILNRPLRVCGVVLNTGAPGGGPFWVKDEEGIARLQIVEQSQFNKEDDRHNTIAQEATHFNPVDIVCATRDYNGDPFNLNHFTDPGAYFISIKSHEGTPIKALELPGLWNGAMAKWNTIFIEVPESTFNPVKTVNDLLKPAHRPNY